MGVAYVRSQAHSFFCLIFIGNIIGVLSKIHCMSVCVRVPAGLMRAEAETL